MGPLGVVILGNIGLACGVAGLMASYKQTTGEPTHLESLLI